MPLYTFTCSRGHRFDRLASYEVSALPCQECSGSAIKETVYSIAVSDNRDNPNPGHDEAVHLDKRDLKARGWDYSRTLEALHNNIIEDKQGNRSINTKAIT